MKDSILHEILDLLDDVLEGMISDEKFLEGWVEVCKIKGRHRRKGNGNNEENKEE